MARKVIYSPEYNQIKIADVAFWRVNIFKEICIVSEKTDTFFCYGKYLNNNKWIIIGEYY